tara:strand:+ start:10476 stop:11684 length:1209 start_codon:yes stop_codon:yes gene_type:complete
MNEEMKNEIEKSVQYIDMSLEDAISKFKEICSENGIETTDPLAKGLWRNYVAQSRRANKPNTGTTSNSLVKKVFGFFVGLEEPRDMMSWNRNKAKDEYRRDADNALQEGIIANAEETATGWQITRYFKGEMQQKTVTERPATAEEMDDGVWIIPLDSTERYQNGGENRNFGKPLPLEQFRRTGVFFGSVEGGEMKKYNFSYKNQGGVNFTPNTYDFVHFVAIPSEDGNNLYGMTETTLASLIRNAELNPDNSDYRNMDSYDFEECLANNFGSHLTPLVEIDRAHITRQTLPNNERFIITDGTVCNMNMMPTKNGNRILNVTDLNAEFDYDNDNNMTTCWVPSNIELDFGIGSSVIIVGKTSQRITDEGPEPVTINVSGLYVTEKRGSPVEVNQPVETDFDWF